MDTPTPAWFSPGEICSRFWTDEGCYITELLNDSDSPECSLAIATVPVGVTTQRHCLTRVTERYVIKAGQGVVELGSEVCAVSAGDSVLIEPSVQQRITNTGNVDLVFYCLCTPRFTPDCYQSFSDPVDEPR